MRIQRIDICGFKSFNQRAVIAFDQGITGIVGPNGCGKSNVVDAIRWVMGEQSAKHLRGRAMEDVIFNGSESQGPSGMAEVALTLRNDRPAELPAQYREFGEITVARRLYRDGRSEYLINKVGCRLLDITELFLGTGVGTRAYSIIEQGKVGLIVNSKPEERRALLEEAAGITKYKSRKRVAERKLDYTGQNLLRISDIVGELKRQLSTLERQARKAERYRTLKNEARELEIHEAAVEWLSAQAQLTALGGALASQSEVVAAISDELARLEIARGGARAEVARAEAELDACRDRAHALELEAHAQAQAEAHAREQQVEVRHRIEQVAAERLAAEAQRGELAVEHETLVELLAAIEEQLGRDSAARAEVETQLDVLRAEDAGLSEDLGRERARFAQAESEGAALRERTAADERRHAELVERAERVRRELEAVSARRVDLSARLGQSSGQSQEFHQQKLHLTERREDLERSLAQAREHFEDNEKQRRQLRDELADRNSRLRSLEELHRNLEGHDRGVRAVLRGPDDKPVLSGVRGLMADAFQASQEIEAALEGYLEHRLQEIVVDDEQAALNGAAFLSDSNAGRATFVPLNARSAGTGAGPTHADCLGRGVELVRVSPGAESIVEIALGRVWVMRSLEAALQARREGALGDLVTLRGEILWESGAVTGGVLEGVGIGALSQRREIDELGRNTADLQGRLEMAQRQHAELTHRIAGEQATLEALSADAHAHEVALMHAQQDMRRMAEQLEALAAQSQALTLEQFGLQRNLDASMEARRNNELELDRREATASDARIKLNVQTAALEALSGRLAGMRDRLTDLKVKAAAERQRCEATRHQVERNQAHSEELRERIRLAEEESGTQAARIETIGRQALEAAARLEAVQGERTETCLALEAATRIRGERVAEVDRLEEGARSLRQEVEKARAEHGKLQLCEREVTLSVTHLVLSAHDRHDVDLEQEITRFHMLPPPGNVESKRLLELREGIARMGEVNLTAISEHEELSARYETLSEQKRDLERSIAQLKEAIVRINRTSRERFRETFELVNAQFAQVFPRLFRGGKAGLVLTEEHGEILEAGVEIFAQPPGKKLQSVDLLSGGEKALTAVAMIFAIFLIKPTPFCLLDEVDAPLDDANVDRYNDIVREISKVSQFILITHNKRTMEIGEKLYGVTMEEPGCSKLVSVRLNDGRSESVAA